MPDNKQVIFTDRLNIDPAKASAGPSRSAAKAEWVDYAVAAGVEQSEAEKMSRDQLIEELGEQGPDSGGD